MIPYLRGYILFLQRRLEAELLTPIHALYSLFEIVINKIQ